MPEEMGREQRAPGGSGMSRLAVPSLAQRLLARSVPLSRTKTSQGALLSSPPASAPTLSTTCTSPRLARKLCNQLPPEYARVARRTQGETGTTASRDRDARLLGPSRTMSAPPRVARSGPRSGRSMAQGEGTTCFPRSPRRTKRVSLVWTRAALGSVVGGKSRQTETEEWPG